MAREQSWLTALPIVLLSIRNTPNETGYSPAVSVMGCAALLPKIMIDPSAPTNERYKNEKICDFVKEMEYFNFNGKSFLHSKSKSYIPRDLNKCTHVWLRIDRVRRPLEAPYVGPYEVVSRSDKTFVIRLFSGKLDSVSIDRLKPATLPSNEASEPILPDLIDSPSECTDDAPNLSSEISDPGTSKECVNKSITTRSGRKVKFV